MPIPPQPHESDDDQVDEAPKLKMPETGPQAENVPHSQRIRPFPNLVQDFVVPDDKILASQTTILTPANPIVPGVAALSATNIESWDPRAGTIRLGYDSACHVGFRNEAFPTKDLLVEFEVDAGIGGAPHHLRYEYGNWGAEVSSHDGSFHEDQFEVRVAIKLSLEERDFARIVHLVEAAKSERYRLKRVKISMIPT